MKQETPKRYEPNLLDAVEYCQVAESGVSTGSLRLAAYNIERGLRLDAIIAQWRNSSASENDIILLSEADRGMARTRYRHVTRDFAEALGFSWAYGIEFRKRSRGDRRAHAVDVEHRDGTIGNAILSRFPMCNLENIRLPTFMDHSRRNMARSGSRSALLGDVEVGDTIVTVASTHLESNSSPAQRGAQMEALLGAMNARDRGQPLVVGGDMNTSGLDVTRLVKSVLKTPLRVRRVPSVAQLERCEPLFQIAHRHGFRYTECNLDGLTFHDRGYRANLDWFFVKNLPEQRIADARIYRGFNNRWRYSDHLPIGISLDLTGLTAT